MLSMMLLKLRVLSLECERDIKWCPAGVSLRGTIVFCVGLCFVRIWGELLALYVFSLYERDHAGFRVGQRGGAVGAGGT